MYEKKDERMIFREKSFDFRAAIRLNFKDAFGMKHVKYICKYICTCGVDNH